MKRRSFRSLSLATLLFVSLAIITSKAFAQEETAEGGTETPAVQAAVDVPDTAAAQEPGMDEPAPVATTAQADAEEASPEQPVYRRRLPNYYSRVVDKNQREAIYTIQEEYFDQIAQLRARIAALETERSGKIEEVLTPQQLTAVRQMENAARLERERKVEQRRVERESE